MDVTVAREIAHFSHAGQRDRVGESLIEHVERVAAMVPPDARVIAYLHDVVEHSSTSVEELRSSGLTQFEVAVLALLTRRPDESFESHALRVTRAPGREGATARVVRLADLDDHIARAGSTPDAPPYAWARRHIGAAERPGRHRVAA